MKVKEELQYIISKRNLELSNIKKYEKMELQIKVKNQKLKE